MEELLKIAYKNFLNTEDGEESERVRIINNSWSNTEKALDKLREILSDKLYNEFYDIITDGAGDVQEAAFICGFSYCAKFLTNREIDFLTEIKKGGEAE